MIIYLLSHWRGQQPLMWSFWVNFVGLRLLIFTAQSQWVAATESYYQVTPSVVYFLVLFLHGVLLIWQIVGVIRACDHHFAEHRSLATLWGAQLSAVVLFLMSATYSLEAIQVTLIPTDTENEFVRISQEHAAQYDISLSENRCEIRIEGSLELGITNAVRRALSDNDKVRTVMLNSGGGNIYEGRGLAKIISEHRLNTSVTERCSSACTLAFIGGVHRTALQSARFGFHQYRVDADYDIIVTDVSKEQERDTALFLGSGVSESFTGRMYSQEASGMWWPDLAELVDVGFLDAVNTEFGSDGLCRG
ncbi:MAG: ATP-dependent protease ClpP protease subunit [Granulosicoccus sp.]|jgi:ATP-dependent protease ClpP protease subunit